MSMKACSIIREVVVLPLVPVTITVVTVFASSPSRSGQIFRASRPGKSVPPRPSSRIAVRASLQARTAKKTFIFFIQNQYNTTGTILQQKTRKFLRLSEKSAILT